MAYEVNVSMFYEREEREWDTHFVLGYFASHEEADAFATALVTRCRYELERMLHGNLFNHNGWDGLTVDIRKVSGPPCPFDTSYELVPGLPIQYWYGDDCHNA